MVASPVWMTRPAMPWPAGMRVPTSSALPAPQLRLAQDAVERTVTDKIGEYLGSGNRAADYDHLLH